MITCEEIISTKITVIIALNLLTTGHQDKFIAQSCLDREGSIYVKNKLGLSWAKLSQSWDLAKLLLSYITSVRQTFVPIENPDRSSKILNDQKNP